MGTQSHFKMDHELELLDKILSSRSSSYCPPSTSKKATIFTRKLAFEEGISGDVLVTLLIKKLNVLNMPEIFWLMSKLVTSTLLLKHIINAMNGSGSGNLDHFFARFHDLIGARNHFFLRERERELNHFFCQIS